MEKKQDNGITKHASAQGADKKSSSSVYTIDKDQQ